MLGRKVWGYLSKGLNTFVAKFFLFSQPYNIDDDVWLVISCPCAQAHVFLN